MLDRLSLLRSLARPADTRIVLLVLDGLGDLRDAANPRTPLQAARTPNLDGLTRRGALGRLVPAGTGITPGSGPGHLALFGYDPLAPGHDIGRGVLEALGLGLEVAPGWIAARGNFATLAEDGTIADRRAGRIPTAEGERLVAAWNELLQEEATEGLEIRLHAGEGYRFVLLARDASGSAPLSSDLADTDPQRTGVPPRRLEAADEGDDAARRTAARLQPVVDRLGAALTGEERASGFTLRGFSRMPDLPGFGDLYGLRAGAFAGYPLYRGVASACGMSVHECGKRIADLLDVVEREWNTHDFFFLHVKQTDQAGEDGDHATKLAVIEEVDAQLPRLLELAPDVVAVTGDHSTPAPMRAHSWHPVPLLLQGPLCDVDDCDAFDEVQCARGTLGTLPAAELMGLLLANAGRLKKFGA
ncbi:MAG: 2,3-bisphosphoglycerate-independent phosphoglycerate mutase [Acidobacteria bacterium]|nr:MAG: 2,3-bisphosphoglycerate-independent phosphoglycerate mutase [Acidobacteriota bacterium]REK00454.1 MAG: 2,3-bisphosphoglycerate-independent phosphoglycerate mutase [Acidobacteriota bacterium]